MGFISDNIGVAVYNNRAIFWNLRYYDFGEVPFINVDGLGVIEFINYAESHHFLVYWRSPKYHMYESFRGEAQRNIGERPGRGNYKEKSPAKNNFNKSNKKDNRRGGGKR